MAPLNYSSRLKDSYFSEEYHEERVKSYVDNLNLLYVALTRAADELYVFPRTPKISKEGRPADIGALLYQVLEETHLPGWDEEDQRLVIGQRERVETREPTTADPLHLEEYPVHELAGRVSVRLHFKDYTGDERGEQRTTPVNEGKLLHELFKRVITREDARPAVRSLRLEGVIGAADEEHYARQVEGYLSRPGIAAWFDGRYRVVNEREILLPSVHRVRPDRVMIRDKEVIIVDYKFGHVQSSNHEEQLRAYHHSLSSMNYRDVTAYLWYVTLDRVVRVV